MLLENWPAPLRSALFKILGVNWSHRLLNGMAADKPSKQELLERIFARNNFDVQVSGTEKIPQKSGLRIRKQPPPWAFRWTWCNVAWL
jgi:hypothetical protein